MTTEQSNRLAMFAAAHAVLASATETSDIPGFPARFATFTTQLVEIAALEARQANPLSYQIALRNEALTAMINATLALTGAALSFADAHGLETLAVKLRVAPADFDRARLAQKPTLAKHLLTEVKLVAAQPGDHGLTPAKLEHAEQLIEAATALVVASRTTVAAKRAATENLVAAFRATQTVLENQLDPLLVPLADTHPEFYARYRAVREIVTRPATRETTAAAGEQPTLATPATTPALTTDKQAA